MNVNDSRKKEQPKRPAYIQLDVLNSGDVFVSIINVLLYSILGFFSFSLKFNSNFYLF